MPMAADLYGDIEPTPAATWRDYVPGLSVVTIATCAAGFLSDHYGVPLTLMALLIGLAINFLSADGRLTPGLAFASRELLRWGIVLVGVRVTFGQVWALGPVALVAVLAIVALTMGSGVLAARAAGFRHRVRHARRRRGRDLRRVGGDGAGDDAGRKACQPGAADAGAGRYLGNVGDRDGRSIRSIAHALGLSDIKAGFLLGASIHDVAQALGAGYSYSKDAGDIAAIVKLTRVALLAPVLAVVALFLKDKAAGKKGPGIPWFVVGFFAVAAVNSTGIDPARRGQRRGETRGGAARCGGDGDRDPLAPVAASGGGAASAGRYPRRDPGRLRSALLAALFLIG